MWPRRGEHEARFAAEQLGAAIGVLPRDDVVGEAGDDVAVDVDGAEVDRRAEHVERLGPGEGVLEAELDEVAVQPGGEPDRFLVPVEDVEGGRLLAEQVVVDDVVPDEVVRPQPREHALERVAVEIAAPRRTWRPRPPPSSRLTSAALVPACSLSSAETIRLKLAISPSRSSAARWPRAPAPMMPPEQAPLRWTPVRAGDAGDGIARVEDGGGVRVEVEVALLDVRVAPRDHEHLLALAHQPLHEAAARGEVEHVEPVDGRRGEQQWHRPRTWSVCGAYRRSSKTSVRSTTEPGVTARFSPTANPLVSTVAGRPREVVGEVACPAGEVRSALVDDRLDHGRVGPREVRRRERVEHVAGGEAGLALGAPADGAVGDQPVDRLLDGQVRLQQPAEEPARLPRRIGEAAVAPAGPQSSERPPATRVSSAPRCPTRRAERVPAAGPTRRRP